ncbi:unnamed protein product [Sympodiomycopsis kandeliae]
MKTTTKGGKLCDRVLSNGMNREAHLGIQDAIANASRDAGFLPTEAEVSVLLESDSVREAMATFSKQSVTTESQLVSAFCKMTSDLRAAILARRLSPKSFWSLAAESIGLLPWEVKKLSIDGSSGEKRKGASRSAPRLPSTVQSVATRQFTPWLEAHLRSKEHDEAARSSLGVPKPDALFVSTDFINYKPSTHDLAHSDAIGFLEFKLKPSADDIIDAVEQAFLELMIQRSLQPLAGSTIVWIVSEQVIRPIFANAGLVLHLAKVDFVKEPKRFLEILLLTLSVMAHRHKQPLCLSPELQIQMMATKATLRWKSVVAEDDVLCDPSSQSIPFRFGGKNTYVARGFAAVGSTTSKADKVVLKWSWPRKATALQEIKKLERLSSHDWTSPQQRLPQILLSGAADTSPDPIAMAVQQDEELSAMLRSPEALVVSTEFHDIWSLSQGQVLSLIADTAWLLCCLWTRLGFVHGDLSCGNVASIWSQAELDQRHEKLKDSMKARVRVVQDQPLSPDAWASCDLLPIAAVMDVENSRFIESVKGDNNNVEYERRAALSATQAFWSVADWSLWSGSMDDGHRIESDLEALLYVAIAVISFKTGSQKGQHWLSWSPKEWEDASRMSSKSFRCMLEKKTCLPKVILDMAASWKRSLILFRSFRSAHIEEQDDDVVAEVEADPWQQELDAARVKMMQAVLLCSSLAACDFLDA